MTHVSKSLLAAAVLVIIGAGCPNAPLPVQELPTSPPVPGIMEKGPDETGAQDEGEEKAARTELKPYYVAYTADAAAKARAEGRVTMYYFWAGWCPICRAEEPKIKSWIESSNLPVSGFRVNYDTQADLKAQYKIPYQHTTVILNANGIETARFNGPVEQAALIAALAAAAK